MNNLLRFSPAIVLGMMVLGVMLSVQYNIRYAKRIREARARGAFSDMNTPKVKSQFRRLTTLALFGCIGFFSSIVVVAIQQSLHIVPSTVRLPVSMVFVIVAILGGYLYKREIDRRL